MKSRSRSCSATALAAREHAIRRSAARFRRLPGPGRSSWNGCTIAVRANTRSIAARREHRCFHTPNALRCVSKHEGTRLLARPHPSRRAHTRSSLRQHSRMRAPQDEDEHRVLQSSPYKQPFSFPRRVFAPGVCDFASLTPNRGVGGAPRNVRVQRHPLGVPSVRHKTRVNALMTRHARRLARRLASHDAGRSPLGAPPWRFWASGPRFRLLRRPPSYNGGQLPSASCSELLAARS